MKLDKKNNRINMDKAIKEVAQSRKIEKEFILENVKEALQSGYNKEINPDNELIIDTELETGDLLLFEKLTVVNEVEDENLKLPVSLSSFSYFAILKVSQVIKHFLNVAESEKIYNKFIDKKGKILSGTIENIDYRYFSVDIGNIFAFIPKEEQIPFERLRHGERVRFYVVDVFKNHLFGQVMGSRKCNEFLESLFALEIPEVGSGVIKIEKTMREPGMRAKVAITCNDPSIDPIGSCIGRAGTRIKSISQELRGEKIDIFLWDKNPKKFIMNAASPSKIVNIAFLEENQVQIIVLETQYPAAIGKRGSAVRLLSKITGYEIIVETLENYVENVDQVELNGNLSYVDLEKLEIPIEILQKCVEKPKT